MNYQHIALNYPALWHGKVAQLSLVRPEKHNAFNQRTIAELKHALGLLGQNHGLHCVLLTAEGQHFCAGADLNWMQQQAKMSEADNQADAKQLAELLHRLDTLPCPTLTLVQGCAFGGALGLIACSDVVIAQPHSRFCLSEVKLGLIPATISPYLSRAIGSRQLRRYALTAELIKADTAQQLGLIHQISDSLEHASLSFIQAFLDNGPQAMRTSKAWLHTVAEQPISADLRRHSAQQIAQARASAEGQEGLTAFFAKRPPAWRLFNNDQ